METGSHEHRDAQLPAPRHNRSQPRYQTCNRTQHQNQTQKNEGYVGERSVRKRQIIAFVGAADPQEDQRQCRCQTDSSNVATEWRSTPCLTELAHHTLSRPASRHQRTRLDRAPAHNRQYGRPVP